MRNRVDTRNQARALPYPSAATPIRASAGKDRAPVFAMMDAR